MLIREHKADRFVIEEPEYERILKTHYNEYLARRSARHAAKLAGDAAIPSQHEFPIWLDLGAHIGSAAIKIARYGAELIYAFEPEPFNYALLAKNIRRYGYILPMNYAVVGVSGYGTSKLYANLGENAGRHSICAGLSETHFTTEIIVNALEFQYIVEQTEAKCAKIDVEGAEHTFSYLMLTSSLEFIIMEFHYNASARATPGFRELDDFMRTAESLGWHITVEAMDHNYQTAIVVLTNDKVER